MLKKLRVKNIVLITLAEMDFSPGLNVLSGETGAGKSIVVDCIMLLLGARFDKSLLRFGAEDGFVEGVFSLDERSLTLAVELGFSDKDDEIVVVKRRFSAEGKSDIKINGQTATASVLRRFMAALIDIYVQHDFLRLNSTAEQLAILDYYDRHRQGDLLVYLTEKCDKYRSIHAEIKDLGDADEREREIDFLKFQIEEIKNSGIFKGEEDELVERRRRALFAEKITSALAEFGEILDSARLSRGVAAITKIESFDDDFVSFRERLSAAAIELDDISVAVNDKLFMIREECVDLDALENRLSFLRSIGKKYGDFDKMKEFLEKAEERLVRLENCDQLYEKLASERARVTRNIYDFSVKLSDMRKDAAIEFCKKIEQELSQLGMENSRFSIAFSDLPTFEYCENHISKKGMNAVEFFFSANAGQPPQPLAKTISGGEMSRFMLALKVVTGNSEGIPTLIFDEIDAGISGVVGMEVAKKLARISARCQVLCVTHLPQIAAMADNHLCVKKGLEDGATVTRIDSLTQAEMVKEITRLQGGMGISKTQEQTAAEIKLWCDDYKNSVK